MKDFDRKWRDRIAERCGGVNFDAPGSGYSFSAVLAEERQLARANIPGDPASALLPLSVADPTWKMRSEAHSAGITYYWNCLNATRYTDLRGIVPMSLGGREFLDTHIAIVDYLKQRFPGDAIAQLTPDWVQYSGHGIKGSLADYVSAALFDNNTTLVFPTPGYGVIKSPMNCHGARVINLPLRQGDDGRWLIGIDQLEKIWRGYLEITENLAVYVNIPHNPTGTGYTAADWQELLSWANDHGAILVVDEAYYDLCYNSDCVSVLTIPGWEESCIVLQSISKGWNATGLRFGWITAHPTMIKALRQVIDVKDSGLLGSTIVSAQECLAHPEWAQETRERYRRLHQTLSAGLQQAGFAAAMPDAGLCQFTPAPKSANGIAFADAAEGAKWLREKLRISVMHYDVGGQPYWRWAVTITPVPECGLRDENAVIAEAIRRLKSVEFVF